MSYHRRKDKDLQGRQLEAPAEGWTAPAAQMAQSSRASWSTGDDDSSKKRPACVCCVSRILSRRKESHRTVGAAGAAGRAGVCAGSAGRTVGLFVVVAGGNRVVRQEGPSYNRKDMTRKIFGSPYRGRRCNRPRRRGARRCRWRRWRMLRRTRAPPPRGRRRLKTGPRDL